MAGGVTQAQGVVANDPTIAAITGGAGVPVLLAQSWVAVSAPADTNEDTLATITIPAGTLGVNDGLWIACQFSYTNNANVKTLKAHFSGAAGTLIFSVGRSTQVMSFVDIYIFNRGATNSQACIAREINTTSIANQQNTTSQDMTASSSVVLTGTKATAGDTLTLEGYSAFTIKRAN